MHRRLVLALLTLPLPVRALSLAELSGADASAGLKQALSQGATQAVALLGKSDGFLGNPKVRIALPDGMKRAESMLRIAGMGGQIDELVTSMNRAAEAAVPQAAELLTAAVKQMTVTDAKAILTGGNDAATRYFRDKTAPELTRRFQPIVKASTDRVQLAQQYNTLASQAASFGLVSKEDTKVEGYVTRKALDGLYATIADEERAIRQNPAAAAGDLAKRAFGAIGR
jgi:hypothetical protein